MSREDAPMRISKSPRSTDHRLPSTSQCAKARSSRVKWTVAVSAGANSTFSSLELLLGLLLGPGHRMHIDLDDLGGCSGPRVGDRQLDLYVGRLPHCHLRPVVVERGVGPVSYTHLTLT